MMPAVYTFQHSDSEILNALLEVFGSERGTVKEQWNMQAEILVEPVGWDALWKLSKQFCKTFDVRFPCVALVTVTSVDFEELTASVEVLSVQHEAITLPESVPDVPLIELWPTIKQREESVNAQSTAELIDIMRFFYTNIWMPWDDRDNRVVLPKSIENRFSLWRELRDGTVPAPMARDVGAVRAGAIDAHERLAELDSSLGADDDDSLLPAGYVRRAAELQARLDALQCAWTLHEDPLVRAHRAQLAAKATGAGGVVALWLGGSVAELGVVCDYLRASLPADRRLKLLASAEEALALEPERVVFCSDHHDVPEVALAQITLCSRNGATLHAPDERSCLLALSEECHLRDLTLDCARVDTAVVMRGGSLRLTDCRLVDASPTRQRDSGQGLVAMQGAKVVLENCTLENFYSGIVVHSGAQVELLRCSLRGCGVGVQMAGAARVSLRGTSVADCAEHSVRVELGAGQSGPDGLLVAPDCTLGGGDLQREVLLVRHDADAAL